MARFVLVHGAFSGAWIWGPLQQALAATHHSAVAFDLPGMGEDKTPAREVTLDSCAARVCEALAASREPSILVGHSMGGIIATQAAARCPEQVAALVYVAAFLPRDGQSLLELAHLPEGADDQVQANIVVSEDPPVAVMPDAASKAALFGSCSEELANWAIERQCPQPLAPMGTSVSIPDGKLDRTKKYYVQCTRDRAIPPPLQRRMAKAGGCVGVFELDTDHTPHLSKTNELADVLDEIAADVSVTVA
jgi:pimeloyl-ACP methyl ester carboxylesterase